MPADVDAPDKVAYGLTFHQLAIVAAGALLYYGVWQALNTVVPVPVLIGAGVVLGGLVIGLALGRRDGLPLDEWLLHAIRHTRTPRSLAAADVATDPGAPDWVETPKSGRTPLPAPLRLPADAIDDDGEISLGGARAAIVGTTTVNLALRTPDEQAALIDSWGRWLNSLSTPTQIVVSAQPVDLASHSRALAAAADAQPHPQLRAACADHAEFLGDLASRRDPLRRQVLVVHRTTAGERTGHAARRRADDTVRALAGLGVSPRVLDGAAVTAALTSAADPYRPPRPGGLAAPDAVITASAPARNPRKRRKP
ncbi:PrgI family protein [Micromonospora craniellae]|uniref:PrgI family protein n=1 Tax=Micromonospora craniellae TaxID=2294034 RepID=A0A372FQL7_9ACTN|nr:PrgI family protein [Micromonospora craniellae]QOC95018.1 PrgI family protein [Micromonospora craniellae]RFS40977.1 PrgI family protein [Micromonospora craniellae]